jgi:integrase
MLTTSMSRGQRADFHSLRYTLATNLAIAGTPPRIAMEIMRHSDIRLTSKTYTDAGLLAVWDQVANLPSSPPIIRLRTHKTHKIWSGRVLPCPFLTKRSRS